MEDDLLFETDRFNLSEVKNHFINPCCFGEDVAAWLREELLGEGINVTEPDQEDWGWYIEAEYRGDSYFIGIGGNTDEFSEKRNQGEWRILVEKNRSTWQKLTHRDDVSSANELMNIIRRIVEKESGVKNVRFENGAPNMGMQRTRN